MMLQAATPITAPPERLPSHFGALSQHVHTHPVLRHFALQLPQYGLNACLVGGAVRDLVLTGELPLDLDVVVYPDEASGTLAPGTAKALAMAMANAHDGRLVPLDDTLGIYRVVYPEGFAAAGTESDLTDPETEPKAEPGARPETTPWVLDIAEALHGNLQDDLARRDVTVNAMAIPLCPSPAEAMPLLYDPFEGLSDLCPPAGQPRQIRMLSEANILEDPLRMLRVFRMAAQLNQEVPTVIEAETLRCCTRHVQNIHRVAAERIQQEFLKLLSAPQCFDALQAMAHSGLLEAILPELKRTRDVPPNQHHHLGLFEHTLELVRQAERFYPTLPEVARQHIGQPFHPMVTRFGLVKLACLLHDIGKPDTWVIEPDIAQPDGSLKPGKHTFHGHEALSAEMTDAIGARLKWGNRVTAFTQHLVRWHLYPCAFGPDSARKSLLKFYRRIEDATPDLLLLALADRFSTQGELITPEILAETETGLRWLLTEYFATLENLKAPPLLDGNTVMTVLKLKPGPKVGKVMAALQEAQQLGQVTTEPEAIAWLERTYGNQRLEARKSKPC